MGGSSIDIGCCWLGHNTESGLYTPYQGGPLKLLHRSLACKLPYGVPSMEDAAAVLSCADAMCICNTFLAAVSLIFLSWADIRCICRIGLHILQSGSLAS